MAIVKQRDHLFERRVELEGVGSVEGKLPVLLAHRLPIDAVEIAVQVVILDRLPDPVEESRACHLVERRQGRRGEPVAGASE